MTRNNTYATHKATPEGRALTIQRKRERGDKYRPAAIRRELGE